MILATVLTLDTRLHAGDMRVRALDHVGDREAGQVQQRLDVQVVGGLRSMHSKYDRGAGRGCEPRLSRCARSAAALRSLEAHAEAPEAPSQQQGSNKALPG